MKTYKLICCIRESTVSVANRLMLIREIITVYHEEKYGTYKYTAWAECKVYLY
jgi:hypothetical protein